MFYRADKKINILFQEQAAIQLEIKFDRRVRRYADDAQNKHVYFSVSMIQ